MQKIMKAKNIDSTSIGKKVQKKVEEKEKKITDLEHKTYLLGKVKEQEEKKYLVQIKESQKEAERLRKELSKFKTILAQNGYSRAAEDRCVCVYTCYCFKWRCSGFFRLL